MGLINIPSPGVEPDHPIPQRLTVHPATHGGFFPRSAVEYCRENHFAGDL